MASLMNQWLEWFKAGSLYMRYLRHRVRYGPDRHARSARLPHYDHDAAGTGAGVIVLAGLLSRTDARQAQS
jgi:hypothetical protein